MMLSAAAAAVSYLIHLQQGQQLAAYAFLNAATETHNHAHALINSSTTSQH